MTLALALFALSGWIAALLFWRSRNKAWRENARNAGAWTRERIAQDERIDELREMVNRERRNTGKAER